MIYLTNNQYMMIMIYFNLNSFPSDGFNRVFDITTITIFSAQDLRRILCGEQSPNWTRDELLSYTEPNRGYTRDSPGFLMLVDVLIEMTAVERKAFLQFTTGCSSLPPGGLKNLTPRLQVVRKESGPYPSVNTCLHYLKLPEYATNQEMKSRLLEATKETGFYLN